MWNTGKIGDVTVYWQNNSDCRFEVYHSDKIELIVRNAARSTTQYVYFNGSNAWNQYGRQHDDAFVEELVKTIPELSQLPEKITRAMLAIKKKEAKPETPQPDQS